MPTRHISTNFPNNARRMVALFSCTVVGTEARERSVSLPKVLPAVSNYGNQDSNLGLNLDVTYVLPCHFAHKES